MRPAAVIIVPPRADLSAGFEAARSKIATGVSVRLVGIGVSLPRTWPPWVENTPGLWVTELTAYRSKTRWEGTEPLRHSLKALADDLFAGTIPGLRGSDVFYPHIGLRAFASITFVMPIVMGLVEQHSQDTVTCTRPDWVGFELYRSLVGAGSRNTKHWKWVARVGALAAAGWSASLAHVVRMYWESRVGLRELNRLQGARKVSLWILLVPDWPRQNSALIKSTSKKKVGTLLHGHIGPGERDEAALNVRRGSELWPGLRLLDPHRVAAWETTSVPPNGLALARACAAFTKRCAVAATRLSARGPLLDVGGCNLDLTSHATDLAKVITIDLARVCMADVATAHALKHHEFRGATILFAGGVQFADGALVARRLREAGASTVDFAHGWSGEPMPFISEPASNYRCVWTHTDAWDGEGRFLVGGMPVPHRIPSSRDSSRVRVLLMSNYAHRDDAVEQTGMEPYQDEILDIARLAERRYDFRWRPHPADRPEFVARAARGLPAELSHGRSLQEDLAWADVVVSSISTALVEALLVDLPVLVHITPDLEDAPQASLFRPNRTFFMAAEGIEKLDAIADGLAAPALLEPESRALTILFGEGRKPRPLEEVVAQVSSP